MTRNLALPMVTRRRHQLSSSQRPWVVGPLVLTLLGMASIASASTSEPPTDHQGTVEELATHLDARVPNLLARYDVPGASVALITGGELAWSAAYGHADRRQRRPMTRDALYRTESISKPVTAWAILRLHEQGRLHLDDRALEHIVSWDPPQTASQVDDITIRQLLSHSGGLALGSVGEHYRPTADAPSLRDNLTREISRPREPGAFHYSNPGFNLLEVLIEDVTGQDFAEHMGSEVLQPLGMHRSSFEWTEELGRASPPGHGIDGAPVGAYVYPEKASGGLLATIDDIGRFVAAGLQPDARPSQQVISARSIRELYSPAVDMGGIYRTVADAHGLGYFIETLPNGRRAVFYGGQGDGWLAHLHAVPATGDGLVVLTNSQRSWPLIAHLLTDWAEWNQGVRPGMSRIVDATSALWAMTGLVAILALAQAGRLVGGLTTGSRRLAPRSPTTRARRAVAAIAALVIVATLLWAVSQDYLFVTSVFPLAAPWLGGALLASAAVLALTALAPRAEGLVGPSEPRPRAGGRPALFAEPAARDAAEAGTAASP